MRIKNEDIKLTDSERQFAADNIRLFWSYYCRYEKRYNTQKYKDCLYDGAMDGYLRSVCIYQRQKKVQKWAFSTVAFRQMNDYVREKLKSEARRDRLYAVSLDDIYDWEMPRIPSYEDTHYTWSTHTDLLYRINAGERLEITCSTPRDVRNLTAKMYRYMGNGNIKCIKKAEKLIVQRRSS